MITAVGLTAPNIIPCKQMTAFCGFLKILDPFFAVLFKTHLAFVMKDSELILSIRKAKTSGLAQEVNALGLIHRKSKLPKTRMQCHETQSFWILALDSLV